MHFLTEQEDATTIFRLKEERLDSRNAGQLKAEFLILAQPDIDTLIVDLTDVGHIDSAGLSALLLAQRQMRIHDGELRLVGLNDSVRSILAMTQLDRILPVFNTVKEALAAERSNGDVFEEELIPEEAKRAGGRFSGSPVPEAPSTKAIRAGAIAAGGLLGAAALTQIMMTPYDEDLERVDLLAFGDEEAIDDEDEEDDDFDDLDDDFDDEEEDLDEEDDVEEEAEPEADEVKEVEPEDLIEDDFEDDDWDDEELDDEDDDF